MAASGARQFPSRANQTANGNNGGGNSLTPVTLLIVLLVFVVLTKVGPLVVSVLMAILLGTILEGPVQRLQAKGFPRAGAIALCYIGILAAIVGLVLVVFPVVQDQAADFRETFPQQMHTLRDEWAVSGNPLLKGTGVSVLDRAIEFVEPSPTKTTTVSGDTAAKAIPIVGSVVGGLTSLITTLVVTFYYLLEKKLVRRVVIDQLSPNVQGRVDSIWTDVESKVGGWLRGQLLLCAIIGSIATVSYGIIGINFWPLLGLWAGITEIIPIVGPWIGGVPAVIVALTMGPDKALLVAVVIITMQALENWFLVPRVMRGAVGLTPLTVFVAILAGTQLMGPVGAVLSIPLAAGLQVILSDFMATRRSQFAMEPVHNSSWRWMLSRTAEKEPIRPVSDELDYGTQIESTETYDGDDDLDAAPVTFEEAPSIIGTDVTDSEAKEQAAESTWPSDPWKPGVGTRANTPWRSAYKGESRQQDSK